MKMALKFFKGRISWKMLWDDSQAMISSLPVIEIRQAARSLTKVIPRKKKLIYFFKAIIHDNSNNSWDCCCFLSTFFISRYQIVIAGAADRKVHRMLAGVTAVEKLTLLISKLMVTSFFVDTVCGESAAGQQLFKSPFVCIVEVLWSQKRPGLTTRDPVLRHLKFISHKRFLFVQGCYTPPQLK